MLKETWKVLTGPIGQQLLKRVTGEVGNPIQLLLGDYVTGLLTTAEASALKALDQAESRAVVWFATAAESASSGVQSLADSVPVAAVTDAVVQV